MILLLLTSLFAPSALREESEVPYAAIQLYERAEFKAARQQLHSQVLSYPEDPALRLWLGKSYFRLRKWDDAIREFDKASKLDPANGVFHLWLGRALGRKAEHMVPMFAFSTASQAGKQFEKAVNLAPDNIDARFDLMEFYLEAPGLIGGGKDKAPAQAKAIAAIDRRLGYLAQARIYIKDKKWDLALRELVQAIEQFPKDARGHADLAGYYFERLDYSRATEAAARSLSLAPSAKAGLILAASWIMLKQDPSKAEQEIRRILSGPLRDEDPPVEEIHFWLGQCYLLQGKKAEARQEFKTALEYNPDFTRAKTGLDQSR